VAAPSGTVTFLFTDIEGSTRLWEAAPDAMRAALERHDRLLRRAIDAHRGHIFATGGDGFAAAFARAGDALDAAIDAQAALAAEPWPADIAIRVRMAVHTGEAAERDGDYFGPAVNRAARLMAVAHGGQVLCSHVTAAVAGDAVTLIDLGEHRLRDLSMPLQVFQVGDTPFPPLRSLEASPGNLPSLVSSFVGRDHEIAALTKALGAHRLVTITGVGGVGKTRLALQVAADLAPGYPDGAWLCELAAATSGPEMAQVVAASLGVTQRPQMTMGQSVVDFLRPRHLLVILDNCEHLLDAAADLARSILQGAPSVRILATSREGLAIDGEHLWPLRSLAVTSDTGGKGSDAVTLFAERAAAVAPTFELDDARLPAVVEICRRLDGIPLAIELAAARVAAMSPAEIAGHLDERFRLLTGGRRGQVERHQTLRAAIEWSYSLLTDAERAVFDRLGVFPASFDHDAAIAVCCDQHIDRWDVIDALGSLVAKSMIGAEHTGDTTRYQLLETLRHFAREKADARGDLDALRRRHAQHYAAIADRVGEGIIGADELTWRPRLYADLDNLRAATRWAFDAPDIDDAALGVQMLSGLLYEMSNQPSSEIKTWAGDALARLDELDGSSRQVVLAVAAYGAYFQGDLERGQALGIDVIAAADTCDATVQAALIAACFATAALGDADESLAILDRCRRLSRPEGSLPSARAEAVLGTAGAWLTFPIGDLHTARSFAEEAVMWTRHLGSPSMLATALATYARMVSDEDAEQALTLAVECIRLIDGGAAGNAYSVALQTAALVQSARGNTTDAAGSITAALAFEARAGYRFAIAVDLAIAALVLAASPHGLFPAAVLSGAVAGPVLGSYPAFIGGNHQDRYVQALADVAARLGQEAYARAQAEGAAMTFDEIVAFALDQLAALADASAGS